MVAVHATPSVAFAYAAFGPQTLAKSPRSLRTLMLPSASSTGELETFDQRMRVKVAPRARLSDDSSGVRSQIEDRSTAFGFMECGRASTAQARARCSDDPDAH
jgi:hypothetical protein